MAKSDDAITTATMLLVKMDTHLTKSKISDKFLHHFEMIFSAFGGEIITLSFGIEFFCQLFLPTEFTRTLLNILPIKARVYDSPTQKCL